MRGRFTKLKIVHQYSSCYIIFHIKKVEITKKTVLIRYFIQSEGAGVLILEEWDHATNRGADVLAELLGSGSTADAHHITAPAPEGNGAVRCMEIALNDAGLLPTDIGQINAHGTSTPLNDAAEAQAIARVFGDSNPYVTGTKGVTGHSLGAAGALEAVAVVWVLGSFQR